MWQSPGVTGTTSFKDALAANPSIPIDPFYLRLPLHAIPNPTRSIADDALDILAAIEGGQDSQGVRQIGILNLPAYHGIGKIAIVALSQGTISSRYYLKNLMGTRRNDAITVSEFIALAGPNHGIGEGWTSCLAMAGADRSAREMCGGRTNKLSTQCGSCSNDPPHLFANNMAGDETFLRDLNGHDSYLNCDESTIADGAQEAPRSRPSLPGGVLYANLYAAANADTVVGGGTPSLDCMGRKLAKSHAPDAANIEITGVPSSVHGNFSHHWPAICVTLQTIVNHQSPLREPGPNNPCPFLSPLSSMRP